MRSRRLLRMTKRDAPPHAAFIPPEPPPDLTYVSLGWGVQSWTIAAMIALGHLPPVDVLIHADTGHESQGTYDHAKAWTPWLEDHGLKVVTVTPKNNSIIRKDWGQGTVQIPAMTLSKTTGNQGQVRRQCTRYWKIEPIHNHLRSLLNTSRPRAEAVHSWQGISLDEWHRMRTSDVRYIKNIYPLVDLRMTRAHCIAWLASQDLPTPPKSACVFCPFHRASQWKQLKKTNGPDWDLAVETDRSIRNVKDQHLLFIHPARVPLEQAIKIPEDYGAEQLEMEMPCDGGHCFV